MPGIFAKNLKLASSPVTSRFPKIPIGEKMARCNLCLGKRTPVKTIVSARGGGARLKVAVVHFLIHFCFFEETGTVWPCRVEKINHAF